MEGRRIELGCSQPPWPRKGFEKGSERLQGKEGLLVHPECRQSQPRKAPEQKGGCPSKGPGWSQSTQGAMVPRRDRPAA